MNIYQIENDYKLLVNQLIENGGELTPELELSLQINKDQLQNKSENYCYMVKQMDAECEIIDNEIKRLQQAKKAREISIDRLKTLLTNAMNTFEVTEIKTPLIKINFRKSESVIVYDVNSLPQMFKTIKVTETPDKVKIKEVIKNGETVVGAELVINNNLQIK
ncbi:Siphovirus Gp157 [uncultured Caudovirales phage]|uniref:Siphovirus Gp157 n=1 Tax=uncultured Caudovirales phage TaxID=2100421 RepID=A0A6J5L191_9CAUD|nr:Siphovirus Gp157 [uncultured Caudovirales phage]